MQTFLPYPDFADTAKVLDRKRLGKQRVETLQIAKAISGTSSGWTNHPAVKMWQGHPEALLAYQYAVCNFWTSFKYKDTCLEKTAAVLGLPVLGQHAIDGLLLPAWIRDEDLHRSHRSNLLRKDPAWYRHFWPAEPDDLPYVWPV